MWNKGRLEETIFTALHGRSEGTICVRCLFALSNHSCNTLSFDALQHWDEDCHIILLYNILAVTLCRLYFIFPIKINLIFSASRGKLR